MANDREIISSSTGTPVVGIRSDVYERRLELIWMIRDDIDHFEARLGDKTLFQNLALVFLSASVPLLVEKYFDYTTSNSATDLAVIIVCAGAIVLGVVFQAIAIYRRRRLQTFKQQLFQRERKLSTTLELVQTSSTGEHNVRVA